MALQSSGQISLSDIATEFKVTTPLSNVGLSSFYNTESAHFTQVVFDVISETVTYFTGGSTNNVDGTIRVYVNGLSKNYTVGVTGRAAQTLSVNRSSAFFTGFTQGSYTITITDNVSGTVDTFSAYVHRGTNLSSVSGYALDQWHTKRLGESKGNIIGKVKGIPKNTNIPSSGQIKFSDFYGAAYYYLSVQFVVTSETRTYFTGGSSPNVDGTIRVYLRGAASNFRVSVTGRAEKYFTTSGDSAYFTSFTSGTYTILISDADNNIYYAFTAIISTGTSSVVGRSLNTWYDIG